MEDKLKEKQIEEMAKDMGIGFQLSGTTRFGPVAAELVEMGYQRIKKDDMVISREEYEKLKLELAIEKKRADESYTQKEVEEIITSKERIKSKETAEKFIKECKKYKVKKFSPVGIDQRDTGVSWIEMPEWKLDEFAKQLSVEIKGDIDKQ